MRREFAIGLALALALAACGHHSNAKKDGNGPGSDVGPAFDAPPMIACTPTSGTTMNVRMIGSVSGSAVLATSPPNDGRLFVIEQNGRIRIFENEQLRPTPFLDMTSFDPNFAAGGEQGLLGLAFHPHYFANNYFYIWYTTGPCPGNPPATAPCANKLARFTASSTDLNVADPNSGVVLLSIPDFATNHNAGMLGFGPDGYLYISTGDGGSGGDPARNGQDPNALLAKILRIDVDHPSGGKMYGIPADNPFAAGGGAPEIFIMGVRNPWRWSFDRKTGDMWIADVGQNSFEELDVLPAGQQNGKNLGWSMYEGNNCYGNYTCSTAGKTFPQFTHPTGQNGWNAIIGGEVYRGPCYPDIQGMYFSTAYSGQVLARTTYDAGANTVTLTELPAPAAGWPAPSSSIHGDARGELYWTTTNGDVYHLEAGP